jgi:wyosine [tRNA(Phe)-imidazoG37] synthetase (radical SAM superfamily)
MDVLWIAAATGAALITALFLLQKLRFVEQWLARERFSRFDKVVGSVEQTNEAYFRSLEAMLKTLESLRARTKETEQRLLGIVAQPADERRERRQAAELLGSGDLDSAAIAAMLNVPVSQRKNRRKPKPTSGSKQAAVRQTSTNQERPAPGVVTTAPAPQSKKPMRRDEFAAATRAEALSGENKKTGVNGTAE